MRLCLFLLTVCVAVSVTAQTDDHATVTYAKNGRLVGVSDLIGLSDCASRSLAGRVSDVDLKGDTAHVKLKENKTSFELEVPLTRLKADDRTAILKDLLRKKVELRVAGYACSADGPISAFSIDRIY